MSNLRQAAQQALEALEYNDVSKQCLAITALRAALAEPERRPLTDGEIVEISAATQGLSDFDFARAIERAHGITGETNE